MTEETTTVNIEQIIEEIRNEIKEKGLEKEILDFDEIPCTAVPGPVSSEREPFDSDDFVLNVARMNQTYQLHYFRPLAGSRTARFVKRVIRKLAKFLLLPLSDEQTAFNSFAVRTENQVRNYILAQDEKDRQIEELTNRVAALEKENAERNKE